MNLVSAITSYWRRLRGEPHAEHQQQLLQLYWNRAELKKELSNLQDERYALLKKLETQKNAALHASDKLDELAAYLGRPEVGSQALLYFQLRALWLECSRLLSNFVADLRKQQEDRERRKHTIECQKNRDAQVAEMQERVLNSQSIADSLKVNLDLLHAQITMLKGFWHYWRRRKLHVGMLQARAHWEAAATEVTHLADEQAIIAGAPLREFPGLSLEGKRIINTAAIAYAEWLIINLPQRYLAPLAKQAICAQIYDANFGTPAECERWMQVTRVAISQLSNASEKIATLKEPIERVRARAIYRSVHDTVPLAESLGDLPVGDLAAGGKSVRDDEKLGINREATAANILLEDYWLISKVLIH